MIETTNTLNTLPEHFSIFVVFTLHLILHICSLEVMLMLRGVANAIIS